MKKLALATVATAALVLVGCEARVNSNGVTTNFNSDALDNAGREIENTFDDLGNAADRTGDAIENGFDRTMNDLRGADRNEAARERNEAASNKADR